MFLLKIGKCIVIKYNSEKYETCFVSSAWMISLWEKYVAYYFLYKLSYVDLNACMTVVYDF